MKHIDNVTHPEYKLSLSFDTSHMLGHNVILTNLSKAYFSVDDFNSAHSNEEFHKVSSRGGAILFV